MQTTLTTLARRGVQRLVSLALMALIAACGGGGGGSSGDATYTVSVTLLGFKGTGTGLEQLVPVEVPNQLVDAILDRTVREPKPPHPRRR